MVLPILQELAAENRKHNPHTVEERSCVLNQTKMVSLRCNEPNYAALLQLVDHPSEWSVLVLGTRKQPSRSQLLGSIPVTRLVYFRDLCDMRTMHGTDRFNPKTIKCSTFPTCQRIKWTRIRHYSLRWQKWPNGKHNKRMKANRRTKLETNCLGGRGKRVSRAGG